MPNSNGGFAVDARTPGNYIQRFQVYWAQKPIPAPGEPPSGEVKLDDVMSRGAGPRPTPRREGPTLRKLPNVRVPRER